MAATDALMEGGQAAFEKSSEKVSFELEPKSVGLTKEQLEAYRNSPFWKPLRTILFVAFWLAWVAMFAAAIVIVVLSPKCAEKQQQDWWQTKVSYQINTGAFYDSIGDGVGDFIGISKKLDLLKKIGVTTVYPSPVVEVYKDYFDSYHVTDHETVDKRFGSEEDFKTMVDAAHDRDMYVVMDFPISSVSSEHKWFKEKKDASRFVVINGVDPNNVPANFYLWSTGSYYHGFPAESTPVLNWKNSEVKDTLVRAMKKYLEFGVDGYHLDHISKLAVNDDGTTNHAGAIEILKEITSQLKNFTASHSELKDKKIVLFSSLRDIEDLHADAKEIGDLHYVIDTSFTRLNRSICSAGVASCVRDQLEQFEKRQGNGYSPYWQFSNSESSRLASRFDQDTANLLTFMQLSLPGALSLHYGQELGLTDTTLSGQNGIMQWSARGDDHHGFTKPTVTDLFFGETEKEGDNYDEQYALENSPLKVYRRLAMLRQRDEALVVGSTVRATTSDDMIVFSRYINNNGTATGSAFVIALNFGDSPVSFSLGKHAEIIPSNKLTEKAEIAAVTSGVTAHRARDRLDLSVNNLEIPAKQGALIRL